MTWAWIFGIVGTLGIGGTIAACILAPAVAIPILQAAVRWFIGCKVCLLVTAIIAAAFVGYLYGGYEERSNCRAAELAAKLEAQRIDLDAAEEARQSANRAKAESDARAIESEQKVADYAEALKARANGACTLVPDDFDGVRDAARGRKPQPSAR